MSGDLVVADFKARIRKAVLPIFLQRGGHFEPIGSCFVVTAMGKQAIALSARHVFDYAARLEGLIDGSDSFVPPDLRPLPPGNIDLRETHLRAVYSPVSGETHLVDIGQLNTGTDCDIAVCHLSFANSGSPAQFSERLRLRSEPVSIGSPMTLGGCSNLVASTLSTEAAQTTRFTLPLDAEFRSGKVVARNEEGSMLVKGPSFVVDRAAEHGMSGGPVIHGRRGDEALVAGIISHGSSFSDETTCAELWPLYGFQIPWLQKADGTPGSLLELAGLNWISDASDPVAHVSVTTAGERRKRVEWKL